MTQEIKHTPAPWKINGDFIESNDGYWICALDNDPQNKMDYSETERANANLIAAAPDLLGALKHLLRFNNMPRGEYYHGFTENQICDKARKVIAKAEGKS